MKRMLRTALCGLLSILAVSCTERPRSEPLTAAEAIRVCKDGLQQMSNKGNVEYGASNSNVRGEPVNLNGSWEIHFSLPPSSPKRYMSCVAQEGGGFALSLSATAK